MYDPIVLVAMMVLVFFVGAVLGMILNSMHLADVVTNLNMAINTLRASEHDPRDNAHWVLEQIPHLKEAAKKFKEK